MLGFVRNMLKWGVARWSDAAATGLMQPNGVVAQFPKIFKFQDFKPYLFGSLVSGATYGQSGTTVTVTATGHGLPSGRDGYRIYWPGSAAVPAGWYDGYTYVDANSYTFTNPTSQTVAAGAAITGALPVTTMTQGPILTIPANALSSTGGVALRLIRSGDSVSASKDLRMYVGGRMAYRCNWSSSISMSSGTFSAHMNGLGGISSISAVGVDGFANTSGNLSFPTLNTSADQDLEVRFQLAQASQWVALDAGIVEVTQ